VRLRVVATVGQEGVRSAAWAAALASERWDPFDEWIELGDVVAVGAVSRQASGMPLASVIR
jgi:hypothetical protein